MVKVVKKKKASEDSAPKAGLSTREKMLARKKALESGGNNNGITYIKPGTIRVRILPPPQDAEIGCEITQFYLKKGENPILSPATFDEPCPILEKYKELKNSDDEDDMALAKNLQPKRRYILAVSIYKDLKGKEIDPSQVGVMLQIPKTVYQDIIDLYLDEEEWGDMTDIKNGYDIKIKKEGSGQMDTTYSVTPCSKTPIDKKFVKEVDLEQEIRKLIKPYDEIEKELNKFLSGDLSSSKLDDEEEEEEEEAPKKKVVKKVKKIKK